MTSMETNRILLRSWRESDAEALYKYASDPLVGPSAGWAPHRNVEESLNIIRTLFNNDHTWAIVLKATAESIGCIGYYTAGESNIGIGPHDAEVGYWVARPYWNMGIATEALYLLVDHCFREKRYDTLWGDCFEDNLASLHVMEHCGFRDSGLVNPRSRLYHSEGRSVRVMKLLPVQKELLLRTSQSWDGAPLPHYPQGQPEITAVRHIIQPGQRLGWHHHDMLNFGILQQGELTIIAANGKEKTVNEGEAVVEMVGTVHHGENRGKVPVILDMFYLTTPGQPLSVPDII